MRLGSNVLVIAIGLAACSHTTTAPRPRPIATSTAVVVAAPDAPAVDVPPPVAPALTYEDRVCRHANDCVLVSVACGVVEAIGREHVGDVAARFGRPIDGSTCDASTPRDAVQARCSTPRDPDNVHGGERSTCITHADGHAAFLRCTADEDCEVFEAGCQLVPMARASRAAARRAIPIGPVCPGILPVEPEVRCAFGFCAFTRDIAPR